MYRLSFIITILVVFAIAPLQLYSVGKGSPIDKDLKSLESQLAEAKTNKQKVELGIRMVTLCTTHNDARCVGYANTALKTAGKAKMDHKVAEIHFILGNYYFNSGNYKSAAAQFEQEYAVRKKLQQARPRAVTCFNLGFCYNKQKAYKKARKYYEESYQLAAKLGEKNLMDRVTRALCDVALAERDYKKAYECLNTYLKAENKKFRQENAQLMDLTEEQVHIIEQRDSTITEVNQVNEALRWQNDSIEQQRRILEMMTTVQQEKLQKEQAQRESLEKENEIQRQRVIILVVVIVFALLALFLIFRMYRTKRRMARVLTEKNATISSQNAEIQSQNEEISKNLEIIEVKNKDIMDSITYASKIQKSLLANMEQYKHLMNDYFIFYIPKDIVSGDFYWAHKVGNKFVFTVGDCTGHSVPGAFMSMLGIALLNQIVAQHLVTKASQILEQMRSMVKSYLGQTVISEGPKDGMDMAICVWDLDTNIVNFSGAYNPLVYISQGKLQVFNAVKSPVGIHTRELDFEDQYIPVSKGDRLYMFSDGYSDQFNSKTHEKFKMARFRQLLLDTSSLPMQRQMEKLSNAYNEWKGDFIQIDDVSVMGVEI